MRYLALPLVALMFSTASAQQPIPQIINLTISGAEVNLILEGLSQLPWHRSNDIIMKVRAQALKQVAPTKAEEQK